jgi:hypothetical protein
MGTYDEHPKLAETLLLLPSSSSIYFYLALIFFFFDFDLLYNVH